MFLWASCSRKDTYSYYEARLQHSAGTLLIITKIINLYQIAGTKLQNYYTTLNRFSDREKYKVHKTNYTLRDNGNFITRHEPASLYSGHQICAGDSFCLIDFHFFISQLDIEYINYSTKDKEKQRLKVVTVARGKQSTARTTPTAGRCTVWVITPGRYKLTAQCVRSSPLLHIRVGGCLWVSARHHIPSLPPSHPLSPHATGVPLDFTRQSETRYRNNADSLLIP